MNKFSKSTEPSHSEVMVVVLIRCPGWELMLIRWTAFLQLLHNLMGGVLVCFYSRKIKRLGATELYLVDSVQGRS